MDKIINQLISDSSTRGEIRMKIYRTLNDENETDEVREIMQYLDIVLNLNLLEENSQEPFINDHHPGQDCLEWLEKGVQQIINPYLCALIADVLQSNKRNKFVHAKLAIRNYLELCQKLTNIAQQREYILRVILILKGLKKGNSPLLKDVVYKISEYVLSADIEIHCHSVCKIAEALVGLDVEPVYFEPFTMKILASVDTHLDRNEFEHYRECHNALAKLLPEQGYYHSLEVGRSYVLDADHFNKTPNASQHVIAALYRKALVQFRHLQLNSEEYNAVEQKLVVAQKKSAAQLEMVGHINLGPIEVNPYINFPVFEHAAHAIFWMSSIPILPKQKVVELTEKSKESFLSRFFSSTSVSDKHGNTVGHSENNEKKIFLDSARSRQIYSTSVIIPMYDYLVENIAIAELEVFYALSRSTFIPENRLSIFARGIYYGFCGNFTEAVHLLVPQIENGLRHVLNGKGIVTRKLEELLQKEPGLAHLLTNLSPLLHEDLLFDLESLLQEGLSENLRNNMMHGLLETPILETTYVGVYTWWLSLRIALHLEEYFLEKEE